MGDKDKDKEKGNDKDHTIYRKAKPVAKSIKIVLQMLIGVVIVIKLFVAARCYFLCYSGICYLGVKCDRDVLFKVGPILEVIGYGLAISAGIDLARMLFTPEIDEAVDPLIVALSAAAIIAISKEEFTTNWSASLALVVMTASIVVLFWVRKTFVAKTKAAEAEGPPRT